MSSLEVMTSAQIADLAGKLARLRWSWSPAELDGILVDLGWTLTGEPQVYGRSLDVGRDSVDGYAYVRFWQGTVAQIEVALTRGAKDSPETDAVRRDVFATLAGVVTEVAGEPWERRPGERPEVRWMVPSGMLQAVDNGVYVELNLLSVEQADRLEPSTADLLDDLAGGDDDVL